MFVLILLYCEKKVERNEYIFRRARYTELFLNSTLNIFSRITTDCIVYFLFIDKIIVQLMHLDLMAYSMATDPLTTA